MSPLKIRFPTCLLHQLYIGNSDVMWNSLEHVVDTQCRIRCTNQSFHFNSSLMSCFSGAVNYNCVYIMLVHSYVYHTVLQRYRMTERDQVGCLFSWHHTCNNSSCKYWSFGTNNFHFIWVRVCHKHLANCCRENHCCLNSNKILSFKHLFVKVNRKIYTLAWAIRNEDDLPDTSTIFGVLLLASICVNWEKFRLICSTNLFLKTKCLKFIELFWKLTAYNDLFIAQHSGQQKWILFLCKQATKIT